MRSRSCQNEKSYDCFVAAFRPFRDLSLHETDIRNTRRQSKTRLAPTRPNEQGKESKEKEDEDENY